MARIMQFMITWEVGPAAFKPAVSRFLQTGGGPPSGVKMVGRWFGPGLGFLLAETSEAKPIYEWLSQWSDLLKFAVTPVMNDSEAAEVFGKLGQG
jgi:hypothetical protein